VRTERSPSPALPGEDKRSEGRTEVKTWRWPWTRDRTRCAPALAIAWLAGACGNKPEPPPALADVTGTLSVDGAAVHVTGHYRYQGEDDWAGRWALRRDGAAVSPELAARLASDTWRCGSEPPP